MYNIVGRYFFKPIGAIICWMFKGFRGNIEDEFESENKLRNIIVGVFVITATAIITGLFK